MNSPSRYSIVTPTVLLTSGVAAIAIVIGAFVSYPLIVASSQDVGQRNLSQLANVTSNSLERGSGGQQLDSRLISALQRESISAYLFSPLAGRGTVFEDLPSGFSQAQASSLLSGDVVSERIDTSDGQILFEGRPLDIGGAVLLVQPASVAGASAGDLVVRLVLSLVIGLVVAIPLGYAAARRLARPLKNASKAAGVMAQGTRGVHVATNGPKEISDIAQALNSLDTALAVSEGRQREFLLSVSHELRTPLTAVKGYGEALSDGVIDGEEVKMAGAVITREAQRLDRLVNDLLDLARLGAIDFAVNPSMVDLGIFFDEVCEIWNYRCVESAVEFVSRSDFQGTFFVDPMRLRQVVDNLAENALRVTPNGGTIMFLLSVTQDTSHVLGLRKIMITIEDTGPGLTTDDLAVAFQPGVLHERYRGVRPVGTGLGLALVNQLVVGMGGVAKAENADETGARFVITIPEMVNHRAGSIAGAIPIKNVHVDR